MDIFLLLSYTFLRDEGFLVPCLICFLCTMVVQSFEEGDQTYFC